MKSVGLIEVEALSPVLIVSKKSKGRFHETTEYLPSSTILGGVARKIIVDNRIKGIGNCSKLDGPNEEPACETCRSKEDCAYTPIWAKKELRLSYCLPFVQKQLNDPPPILMLQSLLRAKESKEFSDGLLQMAVYKLALHNKAKDEFMLKEMKVRGQSCKRKEASVFIQNGSINELSPNLNVSSHVAINREFRSSERGYLYNYTMLARGTKFTAIAAGEDKLMKDVFDEDLISIGLGKSRGYGDVRLQILGLTPIGQYIEQRAKAIRSGFEKIKELTGELLSKDQNVFLGTVTGLTPLPLEGEGGSYKVVGRRLGLSENQIVYLTHKRGIHIRYEAVGAGKGGPTFVLSPVIDAGYAGVFIGEGEVDTISHDLAERETNLDNYQPWFGWLTINHQIHFMGIQFGGE